MWHAAFQRTVAENARSQHHGVQPVDHHVGDGFNKQRGILIVGVQHDNNVGPEFQRFAIAGFLVRTVAFVLFMPDHMPDP